MSAAKGATIYSTAYSVTGAIAAQSEAHDRLVRAIDENRAFEIWEGTFKHTTCASLSAAQAWIGRSKKYRIVQQGAQS